MNLVFIVDNNENFVAHLDTILILSFKNLNKILDIKLIYEDFSEKDRKN